MKRNSQVFSLLGMALSLLLLSSGAALAIPFADVFISSNGTSFGSGNVLGAPDGGGIFLGSPPAGQFLEVGFSTPVMDGAGIDFRIYDIEDFSPDPTEVADVFVSTNGLAFTLVGSITGGNAAGQVDIGGAFGGPINFVRIVQTSTIDAIDIDSIEAFHVFTTAVPEPMTFSLMVIGLAGIGLISHWRKTTALSAQQGEGRTRTHSH